MKSNLLIIQYLPEAIIILSVVLAILFMILGVESRNADAEQRCKTNCADYSMAYLKSEKVSYIGYACFCMDYGNIPRQIPST